MEISALPSTYGFVDALLESFGFSITAGETFLPDAAAYDDLLYKLLGETANASSKGEDTVFGTIRAHFAVSSRPLADAAVDLMMKLIGHYRNILDEQKSKRSKTMSPREVSKIIKDGYETLDITSRTGWGSWERYREVDRKGLLKRAARVAVGDIRAVLESQS